jgi:hypothetical protein
MFFIRTLYQNGTDDCRSQVKKNYHITILNSQGSEFLFCSYSFFFFRLSPSDILIKIQSGFYGEIVFDITLCLVRDNFGSPYFFSPLTLSPNRFLHLSEIGLMI